MKKIIGPTFSIAFIVGILIVGVGFMSLYLNYAYLKKYTHLEQTAPRRDVEILKKGKSTSGAGTSRHSSLYFHLEYLGDSGERNFTIVHPTTEEFEAYKEGDIITVLYAPEDPSEAFLIKTDELVKKIKSKPFKVILFGLALIVVSVFLTKKYEKGDSGAAGEN